MLSIFEIDDIMKQIGIVVLVIVVGLIILEILQDVFSIRSEVLTCEKGKYYCELSSINRYNKELKAKLPSPILIKEIKVKKAVKRTVHSDFYRYTRRHSSLFWDFKTQEGYYIYYVTKNGKSGKLFKSWFVSQDEAEKVRTELQELYIEDKKPITYKI